LKLGALLKTIRDLKLYELRGYDTFEAYIAQPEIGFARATAYWWIHAYELYIEQCKYQPEVIGEIPVGNLQIIAPLVKDDPEHKDEYIALAQSLSRSDLRNAIRERKGLPPKNYSVKKAPEPVVIDPASYVEYVTAHPCCVCNDPNSDCHHFPRTKGAGAKDYEVIPLCRKCHTEYHIDPAEFWLAYKAKIMDFFYQTIFKFGGAKK